MAAAARAWTAARAERAAHHGPPIKRGRRVPCACAAAATGPSASPPGDVLAVLEAVAGGTLPPSAAQARLAALAELAEGVQSLSAGGGGGDDVFARLDTRRGERTGFPEVVWGPNKSAEQLASILAAIAARDGVAVATRIEAGVAAEVGGLVRRAERDACACEYDAAARILVARGRGGGQQAAGRRQELLGRAVVLSAGTADTPVAAEASRILALCGAESELIADCGVAGLHRLLGQLDRVRSADVVVCVAGMDCALPSVVAGLVEAPVVAVPTSVGYGASLGGAAALLSALNACAPGVSVVNIDNGYGGAMVAAKMLLRATRMAKK